MRGRRHSISCDEISEVVQTVSTACEVSRSTTSDSFGEVRLKIIFEEDETYVFGRNGEMHRQTLTIVTGAAARWDRLHWRDAFKKKKSYEMIDCKSEAAANLPQLA